MSDQPRDGASDGAARSFVGRDEAARRLAYPDGWQGAAERFPVRWPRAYLELAASADGGPIRAIGVPDPRELVADALDLTDPVGELGQSPQPYLVRKHRDRALLLVTARCHFYCRFCFRSSFPASDHRDPSPAELDRVLREVVDDGAIEEVILSGGDPLVLDDASLGRILARLELAPQIRVIRIHSRAPVHYPERVTPALVELLAAVPRLWFVTHFSHPVELTVATDAAIARLLAGGIPVLNQTVLLGGVNDAVEPLAQLFRGLYQRGVRPYYLHHLDRVPGSARFRVTVARGLALVRALRAVLPGPAVPAYVIDLPDGSGKIPVAELVADGAGGYRAPNGCRVLADESEVAGG